MNLVIDVGNTRTKYAFFDENKLLEANFRVDGIFNDIEKWREKGRALDIFLSGSGKLEEETHSLLRKLADSWLEASPRMALPLKIGYATPETLGFDRIASCCGAMSMFPRVPLLVVDSGTAITFNYVSADGIFLGGNISAGMEMRFRGLHQFTAKLPYVLPEENYGGMGLTTETAIRNGVMDGILFEVEGYIRRFQEAETDGQVIITGGNSHYLKSRILSEQVEFVEFLGLLGLNEIFRFTKNFNKTLK